MPSNSGLLALAFCVTLSLSSPAQQKLSADEAKTHVGEQATVCGTAVSIHYAAASKGEPTFINLDNPYPRQTFTILIWASDRPKFGNPERKYSGKNVCATGLITIYRDVPEIVVHDPAVITMP